MIKRLTASIGVFALAVAIASEASAATWTKIGSSGFQYAAASTNPALLKDRRRIKFASVVVDPMGNVFVAANCGENTDTATGGGVTIFRKDGSRIDVNLAERGLPGPVTKLVVAGDGLVYGLQNWLEMGWKYARSYANRILQIDSTGNVTSIWCPDNDGLNNTPDGTCDIGDNDRIGGIAVGGDGNVYWTSQSSDSFWKYHLLWRFDVALGQVEESPAHPHNNGWSETARIFQLVYVGKGADGVDYFGLIGGQGGATWRLDSIRWVRNVSGDPLVANYEDGIRRIAQNGESNPGWGRDYVTGIEYDPVRKKVWVAGRGTGGTHIVTRWNGSETNQGMFTHFDPVADKTLGISSVNVWHVNGNAPDGTSIPNFAVTGEQYWVQAMAVNPVDGNLWASYGTDPSYTQGDLGHVVIHSVDFPGDQYWDAGVPEQNAWVMGLAFANGSAYALTLSFATGQYNLYRADDLEPVAAGPAIGSIKTSITGPVVTTGQAVVTYPYPNDETNPFLYIEDEDRSAGIRVLPGNAETYVSIGDRVAVSGKVLIQNGEAVIVGADITAGGSGVPLNPLYITSRDIGGAAPGIQPATLPGRGLSNVGLLVRISGRITEYSSDGTGVFVRLDDGSGSMVGSQVTPGIKVRGFPPTSEIGAMLSAMGILTVEQDGTVLAPVIQTRGLGFTDIVNLGQ